MACNMMHFTQLVLAAPLFLGASAYLNGLRGSTDADFAAFCSEKANLNSNYCFGPSLEGTYLVRCRNGVAHVSDCFFDLYCRPDFRPEDSVNCYESTNPNPDGDGRAACTVNDLVYSDNGTTYPLPDPRYKTPPSPDYSGKPFPIFYPIGTSVPLTCPNSTNSSTSTSSLLSTSSLISSSFLFSTAPSSASGSVLPTHIANATKPGISSTPTPAPAVFPGGARTTSVAGWILAITACASMWILHQ